MSRKKRTLFEVASSSGHFEVFTKGDAARLVLTVEGAEAKDLSFSARWLPGLRWALEQANGADLAASRRDLVARLEAYLYATKAEAVELSAQARRQALQGALDALREVSDG